MQFFKNCGIRALLTLLHTWKRVGVSTASLRDRRVSVFVPLREPCEVCAALHFSEVGGAAAGCLVKRDGAHTCDSLRSKAGYLSVLS